MLFNSYEFLFFFLPLTCGVFFALCAASWIRAAGAWLALMSVVFYGYWSPAHVVLLLASIAFNFTAGRTIARARSRAADTSARRLLIAAVVANLLTLGYFKYANFFVESLSAATGYPMSMAAVVLPIGISFYTFTQIAFLVDTHQGKVSEARFVPYLLFVTYFPHLVAGPVLHHAEMMPQFAREQTYRFRLDNVLSGTTLLVIGLIKKVILADGIAPFVAPAFDAQPGQTITAVEAWGAALAYTLQLYFDFSGYSDMAIGLARLFNVELPLNFDSPYKARNISDFWRRWHMTLSRFLRDYLYVPLGGNRLGPARRYVNLMITMLLGGLWHGAGWTFVIWGGLHGIYLAINHAWQALTRRSLRHRSWADSRASAIFGAGLTFLAVVVAWIFFRATSLDAAVRMLTAMVGANGWALPMEWKEPLVAVFGVSASGLRFEGLAAFAGMRQVAWIGALLVIVWTCPNSQQIIGWLAARRPAAADSKGAALGWIALGALLASIGLIAMINASQGVSEFIYFNF